MKITGLRVEHFLGVRDVEVAMPHPVSIFCGNNDVGKTSLQEALRLAFTGEAVRVRQKKDYGAMLRTGAKSGSIAVDFKLGGKTGRASATLPSFKQDCNLPPPPAIAYVLDAPRFASMEPNERRRFLFDLFGVRANLQDVTARLEKKGCDAEIIKILTPILRGGFEPAERYANEQMQHFRATWKAIIAP